MTKTLHEPSPIEQRVLILAPTGTDAIGAAEALRAHGIHAEICPDASSLCALAQNGAGALLIAEEALGPTTVPGLVQLLQEQPSWSDYPLVLVTSGGDTTQASLRMFSALAPSGNLTLLERPFRLITLISTLQVALRARQRQYQVRALIEQQRADQKLLQQQASDLERTVAERTARLEETVADLEAFSYSVSHDLRAPLRAMQGYAHFLAEDEGPRLSAEGRGYVDRIVSSSNRLDRLVQDILTYSRVARTAIAVKPIALDKVVDDILEQYPLLNAPHATVVVKRPLLTVCGHEAALVQCLSNLIENAVKFVRAGETPHITLWSERAGPNVRVWIVDRGIGIEPSQQRRIFRIFERAADEKTYVGTGIGLAIVQKAVERMGGRVGVESELGAGSRFWIELTAP